MLVVPPPRRQTADPGFDPPFFNDNPFKEAPFVKRIVHFAKKHRSEGIVNATAKHVLSHLEYGGCLADFHGLNVRYNRIRQLEDVDELQALSGGKPLGDKARVRFVNYYTLSSGRQKERKSPSNRTTNQSHTPATSTSAEGDSLLSRETTRDAGTSVSSFTASNVSISVEDHSSYGDKNDTPPGSKPSSLNQPANDRKPVQDVEPIHTGIDELSMQEVEPMPLPEEDVPAADQALDLPPIPELPDRPPTPDFEQYTDKDSRKQAEKEFRRVKKSCDKAIKDRNKAVREREKLLEKRRRKAQKDAEKVEKEEAAQLEREEANDSKPPQDGEENTASLEKEEPTTEPALREPYTVEEKRPKKSKKFCTLPRKVNGARDSTWVDIYMDGMDEVSAHCGLFFPGPHYERLVGDVTSRIIGWVQDDLTKRTILEMEKD